MYVKLMKFFSVLTTVKLASLSCENIFWLAFISNLEHFRLPEFSQAFDCK